MTIRIITKTQYWGHAIHVGGDTEVQYKTFEIDAAELEGFLTEPQADGVRSVVGYELVTSSRASGDKA